MQLFAGLPHLNLSSVSLFMNYILQDIVYSALNEQCTARMIERTSVSFSDIGKLTILLDI